MAITQFERVSLESALHHASFEGAADFGSHEVIYLKQSDGSFLPINKDTYIKEQTANYRRSWLIPCIRKVLDGTAKRRRG